MLRTAAIWEVFSRLERQKEAVLSQVISWPEGRLLFRQEANSWSTLDVVDHLVKVERSSLAAVRSSLPHGHHVTLKDRLGGFMVITVMKSPMRVKVPSSASAVFPDFKTDLLKVSEEWSQTRVILRKVLESLSAEQLRCGLLCHPVAGWMTMSGAMAFLSAHMRHHGFQLRRLEKASMSAL